MRRAALTVLVVAWALAAGCGREAGVSIPMPDVRVIDLLPPVTPGALHGTDVKLGPFAYRTVTLPATTLAIATLDAPSGRYVARQVPPDAAEWPRMLVLRQASIGGVQVALAPTVVTVDGGTIGVPVQANEAPAPQVALALYAGAPTRTTRVDTPPFTVPAGADLRFAIGVQALAARGSGAVDARISVLDGRRARPLWRRTLSERDDAWHDAHASLAGWAGRTIRLRFASRPRRPTGDGVLAVFGEPMVLAPRVLPARPFNVVLVSMDALRSKSVSAYGAARPTTPTIDALASDGILFENAFSTAAFTLPGHLSMLTGLWFRTHGAIVMTSVLSPAHRTLAEVLQSAGWATGAFTSGAWIVPWVGFRRGFDVYYELDQRRGDRAPDEPFRFGVAWMRENADRPFFAFLHDYTVHMPYLPPPPYDTMFEPLPPDAPDEERKRLAYEREVRYADDQIRALLDELEALGVADRTLVIVTADHGEQFFEHGNFEHTYDLHDEVAHVPLVMRLPGVILPGRRVAEPVSLADIVPTIVDLAGLAPVNGVDGLSLVPLADGRASRLPRDGVFSEAASDPDLGWANLSAVHTRAVSCIRDARRGTDECWDRRRDPWQEGAPIPPTDASPDVANAKDLLTRFTASKPPAGTPPSVEPREGVAPAERPGVESERREQLRALGYVE